MIKNTKMNTYHLSPQHLEELHKKYGLPGEMSPGQPAKKKRNRPASIDLRNIKGKDVSVN